MRSSGGGQADEGEEEGEGRYARHVRRLARFAEICLASGLLRRVVNFYLFSSVFFFFLNNGTAPRRTALAKGRQMLGGSFTAVAKPIFWK